MSSSSGADGSTEDEQSRLGSWTNHQNPHPELPNPHLPQKPQVALTREELRVLQECNSESFWYRSLPASLFCVGTTQLAVAKGYLTPHHKYGAGFKTLGAALLGYILGKISYQNECRQKIMALPNSKLAETLRQRAASRSRALPSEFPPESASSDPMSSPAEEPSSPGNLSVFDAKPDQQPLDLSTGNSAEQEQQFKSYGDLRRQNREIYNDNQVVKWQNIPKARNQQPPTSQIPEEEKPSEWIPPPIPTRSRGPKNQYGDVWEE